MSYIIIIFTKYFDRNGRIAVTLALIAFACHLTVQFPRQGRKNLTVADLKTYSNKVRLNDADSISFVEVDKISELQYGRMWSEN